MTRDEFTEAVRPDRFYWAFTDGGCDPNPGQGGWGAVLGIGPFHQPTTLREVYGGDIEATNNRMELFACIAALEAVPIGCDVKVHSDSQYVIKGITSWINGWKRNGWRRGRDPRARLVLNADLWQRLDLAREVHRVSWIWVRGHNGTAWNERADKLATTGRHAAIRSNRRDTLGGPIVERTAPDFSAPRFL